MYTMSGPTRHALLLHINPYDTLWQSITTTDDYLFIHSAFTDQSLYLAPAAASASQAQPQCHPSTQCLQQQHIKQGSLAAGTHTYSRSSPRRSNVRKQYQSLQRADYLHTSSHTPDGTTLKRTQDILLQLTMPRHWSYLEA